MRLWKKKKAIGFALVICLLLPAISWAAKKGSSIFIEATKNEDGVSYVTFKNLEDMEFKVWVLLALLGGQALVFIVKQVVAVGVSLFKKKVEDVDNKNKELLDAVNKLSAGFRDMRKDMYHMNKTLNNLIDSQMTHKEVVQIVRDEFEHRGE